MSIVLKISTEDDRVSLADQLDQEVAMVRTPGTVAPQKGNNCLHRLIDVCTMLNIVYAPVDRRVYHAQYCVCFC